MGISVFINGRPEELPSGITVATLLERLDLAGKPLAVEINGEVIPREEHPQRVVAPGDRIEIVTLVGGG
jgi:sulfur carrier protein